MGHWFKYYKTVHEYEGKMAKLKQKVEPQPLGACAILVNSQGEVLLGKRKNGYKAGYYGLPGGRVEVNEPIHVAIQREVEEETGLKLGNLTYLGVVRENQDTYDFIHFVYLAKDITQTPVLCEGEKCEGWEWMDLSDLKQPVLPGHISAIELYLGDKKIVDTTK